MTNVRITDLNAGSALTGDELFEVSQPSTTVKITAATISAAAPDNSFNDSGSGFITAGFAVADRVRVISSMHSANNLLIGTITALTASKLTIGGSDGDVIVDETAGAIITIAKWVTKRISANNISGRGTVGSAYSPLGVYGPNQGAKTGAAYQSAILAEGSLVAYYPLDDAFGSTTALDKKGTNHASMIRPAILGNTGRLGDKTCYLFNLATALTNNPCGAFQINRPVQDDFTIEFWILVLNFGINGGNTYDRATIFGKDESGNANDLGITYGGTSITSAFGYVYFFTYANALNADGNIGYSLFTGRWRHVCLTREKSSGNTSFYIDGNLVAGPTAIRAGSALNASTIQYIGGFNGFMSDLAFYSSVLSGGTIASHFSLGSPY